MPSIGLICELVVEGILSKMVYGLVGTGGIGKDIGIGCTNFILGKVMGVELVLGTTIGSTSNLFPGSSSFILYLRFKWGCKSGCWMPCLNSQSSLRL